MLKPNHRLLIVDDTRSIQEDFRKILGNTRRDTDFTSTENFLFGTEQVDAPEFALTMASQGEEAIAFTETAMAAGEPYALAFVDIRMPPGLDGVETARRLWEIDPDLSIVISRRDSPACRSVTRTARGYGCGKRSAHSIAITTPSASSSSPRSSTSFGSSR